MSTFEKKIKNVWDKNVPVEKSTYVAKGSMRLFNEDIFFLAQESFTMLDLFCGAGGFSVGGAWAGCTPVMGIDHFAPAINTWAVNHPYSLACLGDIRRISAQDVQILLKGKGVSKIHLLTGGVPCQGFSIANRKHNDDDERNFLFLEYMKFVDVFEPDYILLENVQGMRSTAGGKFEQNITTYMEKLGYMVSVQVLNAADYGVPQVRKRLIFVGVRKERGLPAYVFPEKCIKNSQNYLTVADAIGDLPSLGNNEGKERYTKKPSTEYQKMLRGEGILPIAKPCRLTNHSAPNHPLATQEKIAQTPQGMPMYARFKQRIRLSNALPSPTQLAGGIRPQFQFGHPTQARGLSIRERARIQSFPDSYVFTGGTVQERVQTGNAIPPLLVYALVKEMVFRLKASTQFIA